MTPGAMIEAALSEAGFPPTREYEKDGSMVVEWRPPPPRAVFEKAKAILGIDDDKFEWPAGVGPDTIGMMWRKT